MYLATVEKSRAGLSDQALKAQDGVKVFHVKAPGGHQTREGRRAALAICCVSPVGGRCSADDWGFDEVLHVFTEHRAFRQLAGVPSS